MKKKEYIKPEITEILFAATPMMQLGSPTLSFGEDYTDPSEAD